MPIPTAPQVMNFTIQIMQQDDNGIDITIAILWERMIHQDLFCYYVTVVSNQTHDLLTSPGTYIEVRQLMYDTLYNVSMLAVPRCGNPRNSTPLDIGLFYGKYQI